MPGSKIRLCRYCHNMVACHLDENVMKMNIEIFQCKFNEEWFCEITTSKGDSDVVEYWSMINFCDLLNLLAKKIPNAKLKNKKEDE